MTDANQNPEAPAWSPEGASPDVESTGAAAAADGSAQAAGVAGAPAAPVAPAPTAGARSPRHSSSAILLGITALIALGGIGFAFGRMTAPATSGAADNGTLTGDRALNGPGLLAPDASGRPAGDRLDGALAGNPARRAGTGAATITGTVMSISADSMIVKLADGSTVTIALSSSTTYHAQTSTSSSSVTAGSSVTVQVSTTANPAATSGAGSPTRTATDVTVTAD